jgi:hypothetical protein
MGTDGVDVQWRCEAELDSDVVFDAVHVSCEGFRDSNDPWVLEGSCGLEYKLKFTNKYHDKVRNEAGRERQEAERRRAQEAERRRAQSGYTGTHPSESTTSVHGEDNSSFKWFFMLCAVVLLIVFCTKQTNRNRAASYASASPSGPGFAEGVAVGAMGGAAAAHIIHEQTRTTETTYTHSSPSSHYEAPSQTYTFPTEASSSPKSRTTAGFGTTSRR